MFSELSLVPVHAPLAFFGPLSRDLLKTYKALRCLRSLKSRAWMRLMLLYDRFLQKKKKKTIKIFNASLQ